MKDLPVVAIVGRPNVGKSTLFNRIAGRRIAIEDPTWGTTRDRLAAVVRDAGPPIELVDTGGMFVDDPDRLTRQIHEQIERALAEADLLVLVVDARDGRVPLDDRVAERLRPLGKPVVLAVNKCDTPTLAEGASAFAALGFGEPVRVSAKSGEGRSDLLERVRERLPEIGTPALPAEAVLAIAVVGRQNTGKSTLLNALAGEPRVIVSEVPGTTRDAVDVRVRWKDRTIVVIDTAGMRRPGKAKTSVDFFSLERAERAITRADVCLLMLDAREEITALDRKIGSLLEASTKPTILAVNKWDLAKGVPPERYVRYLQDRFPGLSFAPVCFLSAKEGTNVSGTVALCFSLHAQANTRVATGPLNRVLQDAFQRETPVRRRVAKVPKLLYATQTSVAPPTFVCFVNDASLFGRRYERYLGQFLRKRLPFPEVPIRIVFRGRELRGTA